MREAIAKELVGAVQEIAGNGYAVTTQETTKNTKFIDTTEKPAKSRWLCKQLPG